MKWENLYSPENYEHYKTVAEGIFKSRTVQRQWLPNPESVLFVMQMGIDMGISPLIALDKLRKVQDGWMLEINLARSLVAQKGGTFKIVKETDKSLTTQMRRVHGDEILEHEETITLEQLQKAGTANKDTFKRHPKQIFRAAAYRQSCAILFPDILFGTTVVDFEVENGEAPTFTDDTGETVNTETTTEEEHRPKGSNNPASKTRTRRTKKRIELERLVGLKESVGTSLVEGAPDIALLKEAGYTYVGEYQTYMYHVEEKKEEHPPAAPPKEEEPPTPPTKEEEPPTPETDWDLRTERETPKVDKFNPQEPDHIKILTKAAKACAFSPEVDKQVKAVFLDWSKEMGLVASEESLKAGLEQCASQFLN